MSDYDFRPGGSLKLKGGVSEGGVVKKKKKKSKAKAESSSKGVDSSEVQDLISQVEGSADSGSGRNSPAVAGGASSSSRKTEAERRFEAVQKKRLEQRVSKLANKTHKDRVSEFNTHLESLSEHHDIPKVGPG